MNLTPDEREKILSDYAEGCRLRVIESNRYESPPKMAIHDSATWVKNCKEDTIKAIREGNDTWERIAKVTGRIL